MFKKISNLLAEGQQLTLIVRKNGICLTVALHPQSGHSTDPAQERIIPLSVTGTAEELDTGFFDLVSKPVMETTELFSNLAQYKKALERAGKEQVPGKDKRDQAVKPKSAEPAAPQPALFDNPGDAGGGTMPAGQSHAGPGNPPARATMREEKQDDVENGKEPEDMFKALMDMGSTGGTLQEEKTEPAVETAPTESAPAPASISAEQWNLFQQFQAFQKNGAVHTNQ